MTQYIENNWSGGISINETVWQPNSYQMGANMETRWPIGGITLASNRYEQTTSTRINVFVRNYWIETNGTVRQLDPSTSTFTDVWNLWLSSVLNACEFQWYIYFARTSGLSRISITNFLSQSFWWWNLQTNYITYTVKTTTTFQRITTTTNAHRIPFVDTGIPSTPTLIDRDLNEVSTYATSQTNNQRYIYSNTGSSLNNWPYALSYTITASVGTATTIPMLNYYDDKLIFAVGNKVLYIQDLGNYVYLWMNLIVWQIVSWITETWGYVKIYAIQDNKDTRILFWRGWEVTGEWYPAKPEQTIKLNGYVVWNIATDWQIDYAMAWEPDYGNNSNQGTWHLFAISGGTSYKIKSGRFLRRWPTQDFYFSYRQIYSNLTMKNWILYVPCGDWLYSYGTLHKDIGPSMQKDFDLRTSGTTKIIPFAIHQYNGTVYMSYQAQDTTYKVMKYAQDYEYASYEESWSITSRVFTGGSVTLLKRIDKIMLWFEFETTPDWVSKSWSWGTIRVYLRNNRNSNRSLVKTITDTNYKWTQTMRAEIGVNDVWALKDFYVLEYKIEIERWDQTKTPHIYEFVLNYSVVN